MNPLTTIVKDKKSKQEFYMNIHTVQFITFIILFVVFTSCGSSEKRIENNLNSTKDNIFTEAADLRRVSSDYATLQIKISLKSHKKRHYPILPFLNSKDHHGDKSHQFLINIDGQALLLNIPGTAEDTNKNDYSIGVSEQGDGVRYMLNKNLRLKSGRHKVALALPEEDYITEFELDMISDN